MAATKEKPNTDDKIPKIPKVGSVLNFTSTLSVFTGILCTVRRSMLGPQHVQQLVFGAKLARR